MNTSDQRKDKSVFGLVVVMGVSGCGKSSVAKGVAEAIDSDCIEADELLQPVTFKKWQAEFR